MEPQINFILIKHLPEFHRLPGLLAHKFWPEIKKGNIFSRHDSQILKDKENLRSDFYILTFFKTLFTIFYCLT